MWTIVPGHRIALILRKKSRGQGQGDSSRWRLGDYPYVFFSSSFFNVCDTLSLSLQLYCPDITVIVDWALKINYLSV